MNKLSITFQIILAFAFIACTPRPVAPEDNTPKKRVIIYSVGQAENRQKLETNGQWDNLLEMLCDKAMEGNVVTFYNMCQTTYTNPPTKKATTFSTSSRDEMIAWMKEMEKQGKTVVVTYDSDTGKWNGNAYATAPSNSSSELILGTWHLSSLTAVETDNNGNILNNTTFVPEDDGDFMVYTFNDNGILTLTVEPIDGVSTSDEAEWNLSDEGELSSDLLPNKPMWNVNWITSTTMIISCNNPMNNDENLSCQMKFDKR